MQGIFSELNKPYDIRLQALWRYLAEHCDLEEIQQPTIPHFSWHIAESYQWDEVEKILKEFCLLARPFTVHTAGLGIFNGEKRVIFLNLIKDRSLLEFHYGLWERVVSFAEGSSPYYAPDLWVPHITLAVADRNPDLFNCLMQRLICESFDWTLQVTNLAIGDEEEALKGNSWLRFDFGNCP